jgi:hypothetical protein
MKRTGLLVATILSSFAAGLSAQTTSGPLSSVLTVGSRVRVTATGFASRPAGMVTSLDETTLTMAIDDRIPIKVPVASITGLETSLGRRRNTVKGLVIGAASGVLIGLLMPVDPNDCGYYSENMCSREEALLGGTIAFGAIGAGIGALIKTDRWSRITVNAAGQVGVGVKLGTD